MMNVEVSIEVLKGETRAVENLERSLTETSPSQQDALKISGNLFPFEL